jgi:hypothetical protein
MPVKDQRADIQIGDLARVLCLHEPQLAELIVDSTNTEVADQGPLYVLNRHGASARAP